MPVYQIKIGQATYEVESTTELTDAQAYQYALQQQRASGEGVIPPALQSELPPNLPPGAAANGMTPAQLREYVQNQAPPFPVASAASPAPSQNEIPVLDDESRRLQAKNELFAATGNQTPYGNVLANDRALQEQINELKKQRDAIYRTPRSQLSPADKAAQVRAVNEQIAALEKQQSSDPYSMVGGTIGAVGGGVAGAAGGSVVPGVGTAGGALAGSMMGGFLGTLGGALVYANKQNMTPTQASDYLFTKGIESLAYDAVGNIIFMGGGKLLGKVAKDSAIGRSVVKLLGGDINMKLKAPREAYLPGERVFRETGEEQLRDATEAGARLISSKTQTPARGQLTGDPGFFESIVHSKDPGGFAAVRREQQDLLEPAVERAIARMRGDGAKYAGTDLRNVFEGTEAAVKRHLAPVWDELRNMRGKDVEIVDFREISDWARKMLDANAKAKVKTLTGEQLEWVRKLAGGEAPTATAKPFTFAGAEVLEKKAADNRAKKMAYLSPGEAQDVLSKMLAIARDAESPTNPNSELGGFATKVAGMIRGKLDDALASDPKFAEARDLYRDMMDTLYNPVLDAARRGGESAAGRKAIKLGEVEGVQALEQLKRLAGRVDSVAGTSLRGTAEAAHRGSVAEFFEKYAGTPEALGRLHQQMGNPDFRKTFEAAVPDASNRKAIEVLSQAAQLVQRSRGGSSGSFGAEAGASTAGRAAGQVVGAPNVGSLIGRLMVMISAKDSAKVFIKPEFKAELPRVTGWLLHAARGSGRGAKDVPEFVTDFYNRLEAEIEAEKK